MKADYRSHEQEYFLEVMIEHEADGSVKIGLLLTVNLQQEPRLKSLFSNSKQTPCADFHCGDWGSMPDQSVCYFWKKVAPRQFFFFECYYFSLP